MIENKAFQLDIAEAGYVKSLFMKNDPFKMNWVIEDDYLKQAGFIGLDKLFGHFEITTDKKSYVSSDFTPIINTKNNKSNVQYNLENVSVNTEYDLNSQEDTLFWTIELENKQSKSVNISDFGVWASFAYVMFRDKNVLRNIHNSAAVFPSISTNYTKINMARRGNAGGNVGLYQTKGTTLSVGTFCEYENLFFENVSPSLDGLLYHKLILAGGYPEGFENRDWIYAKDGFTLAPNEKRVWTYAIKRNETQEDFKKQSLTLGHPIIDYTPLNIVDKSVRLTAKLPDNLTLEQVNVYYHENEKLDGVNLTAKIVDENGLKVVTFTPNKLGEHKAVFSFTDGTEDFVIFNVMEDLAKVINERAAYICDELYNGVNKGTPYAFEPVSNQGESLGKLNLVLKKNLLGDLDPEQVRKVEESAVKYVRPKWFENGDFLSPANLYGSFYRCMDFEYIGHLFYLLSEFDEDVLVLNSSETYLEWTADVFNLRVNPDLHKTERGKEEAQMLGVYFLYIQELLTKLKKHGLTEKYEVIKSLWEKVTHRVDLETPTYKAAITEHYYDNAGFGPTAGALSESGMNESAEKYGQLLLANIGYSNDFRSQNPDRWWEALTYMIHSLWGGVTAAASFKVYEGLKDPAYLDASFRATAGILYCYDTHSSASLPLKSGMAASTYAVAGPHLNRTDLSRERFGQATFYRDGGIFARLFDNDTQTPDWDMGEELVAYLESFGKKTFVQKTTTGIKVINGTFEETENEYVITSFAPYIKEFYLVEDKDLSVLSKRIENGQIVLQKGAF